MKTVVHVSFGATFKASHYKFYRKALVKRSKSSHRKTFFKLLTTITYTVGEKRNNTKVQAVVLPLLI